MWLHGEVPTDRIRRGHATWALVLAMAGALAWNGPARNATLETGDLLAPVRGMWRTPDGAFFLDINAQRKGTTHGHWLAMGEDRMLPPFRATRSSEGWIRWSMPGQATGVGPALLTMAPRAAPQVVLTLAPARLRVLDVHLGTRREQTLVMDDPHDRDSARRWVRFDR